MLRVSDDGMAAGSDPIATFRAWMKDAEEKEWNDPNAAALATASREGTPSVRIVLMKRLDERGFAFYTNAESQKGVELAKNPRAAMCFHWKSLRRQVRAEGLTELVSEDEADGYFASRPRGSQIAAWSSDQSRPLESRELLEKRVEMFTRRFADRSAILRPNFWSGFRLRPDRVEFWQDQPSRLHDRLVFIREDSLWRRERLFT